MVILPHGICRLLSIHLYGRFQAVLKVRCNSFVIVERRDYKGITQRLWCKEA